MSWCLKASFNRIYLNSYFVWAAFSLNNHLLEVIVVMKIGLNSYHTILSDYFYSKLDHLVKFIDSSLQQRLRNYFSLFTTTLFPVSESDEDDTY